MTRKIKLGIIGLGKIAQIKYIPTFLKCNECIITAICDQSPVLLKKIGEKNKLKENQCYTSVDDFFEADFEIVFILNHNHEELIKLALDKGKHVFVEKPVCWESYKVIEIMEKAKEKGLMVMPGYMKLYDEAYSFLKKIVSEKGYPICVNVKCLAGNIKKWINPIYSIEKESDDEKENTALKIKEEWNKFFVENGYNSIKQQKCVQTLLQLGIHHFNLLHNVFEKSLHTIQGCYVDNGDQRFSASFKVGDNTICNYVLLPLFDSFWKWSESYEFIYKESIVKIEFPNPFLENNQGRILLKEDLKTFNFQFSGDSFEMQIRKCFENIKKGRLEYNLLMLAYKDIAFVEEIMRQTDFGDEHE